MCGNCPIIMTTNKETLKTTIENRINVYELARPCTLVSTECKYTQDGDLRYVS